MIERHGWLCQHEGMSTLTRPDREPPVDKETDRIVCERDATFDKDKKTAEPWRDVKNRILDKLKHPQPR